MFRNYFITAFRNLKNNLPHTILNVVGLTVGIACCLVVFTIINFEYPFVSFHRLRNGIHGKIL